MATPNFLPLDEDAFEYGRVQIPRQFDSIALDVNAGAFQINGVK